MKTPPKTYTFKLTKAEIIVFAIMWWGVGILVFDHIIPFLTGKSKASGASQNCSAENRPKSLEMKFQTRNGAFFVECLDVANQETCNLRGETAAGERGRL